MTDRARTLRREQTADERALWFRIRHNRPRFTRQLPIGRYVVDFACRSLKIAIEVDESQHLDAAAYDGERTTFLQRLGWRVLRFWNSDVRDNADGVAEAILAAGAACSGPTHPQLLPFREGSRSP